MATRITKETCDILITAEEAFCAFETAVLQAENRVAGGFRVFDFFTSLQSEAAQEIGKTWFDLIAHKLDQGVEVSLKLTDFDPVAAADLHACTWRTLRQAAALREATRNPGLLHVNAAMHGARIGWLSAMVLWIKSRDLLNRQAKRHNALDRPARHRFLQERPGLAPLLRIDDAGAARARIWPPVRLVPATHHHKLAVIDGKSVYIGGLDLDDRRYDTKRHDRASSQTWHDVQLMVRDTGLARAAETHLREFDRVTSGAAPPSQPPRTYLRTLSVPRSLPAVALSPRPLIQEVRGRHLDHIASARDLIYLETQFLRDQVITAALCRAAVRAPDLGLVVILPAAPEEVAFKGGTRSDSRYGEYLQAKSLARLSRAFGPRLFAGSPVKPSHSPSNGRDALRNAPILYVHAKVSIFDDSAAIVSSANLNGRSMNWDTEAGVELTDPALVGHLKTRCMTHWLPDHDLAPFRGGPGAPGAWQRRASSTAKTPPEARNSFVVPYKIAPARRFGRNLPGVPEEMV